jgi:hypothetical protein
VNRETGKRATICTPPELTEQRVYEILPSEAADWVASAGLPQPPAEYDPVGGVCLPTADAAISTPQPFAYVHGTVEIRGTAQGENFAFYRVQLGQGLYPQAWTQIGGDIGEPMQSGVLQRWDTQGLDGLYSIQLVVVKNDPEGGPPTFETSTVPVTVDNQPPTILLLTPSPEEEFTIGLDESVVIQPQVQDNLSLAYVAFYVDGAPIETVTAPPYSTRWKLTGPGKHTIFIRVYDQARNMTESETIIIVVKPGTSLPTLTPVLPATPQP